MYRHTTFLPFIENIPLISLLLTKLAAQSLLAFFLTEHRNIDIPPMGFKELWKILEQRGRGVDVIEAYTPEEVLR